MAQLSTQRFSPTAQAMVVAAAFVVVVAGMRAAEAVLVPFLLSVFISIVVAPPVFWLRRRGAPMALALLLAILVFGAILSNSIRSFTQAVPAYSARLQSEFSGLLGWLSALGVEDPGQQVLRYFDPGDAMQLAARTLTSFGGVLTNAFLILLTVAFILLEASTLPAKVHAALAQPGGSVVDLQRFVDTVQRYMAMKTMVSLLTGCVILLALWIIGVDYPLLWGMLAFLLNYVPNIGSIIASVPAVLLAFVQLGGVSALVVASVYLAVNVVIGSILEPRVMGQGLGLSTLVVFLSLVFWGWVLGPVGMLLSVPLTMTVKIALESREDSHWLAVMLGPAPPPDSVPRPVPGVGRARASIERRAAESADQASEHGA
jgi:predicted PurR-regulated permease PerM